VVDFEDVVSFHGHRCPGLAVGYRMARSALEALTGGLAGADDEELVAVVENDACGVDALQVVTGCTFGKGNLVHRNHGKSVVTLISRRSGRAVRVCYHGKNSPEDTSTNQTAYIDWILSAPDDDILSIQPVDVAPPPTARIRETITCSRCGERVMNSRVVSIDGKPTCIPCSRELDDSTARAPEVSRALAVSRDAGGDGGPATIRTLEEGFRALGVRPGMTLLVHSSLSSIGWVCGGAMAVVLALESALGPEGTLVMPTHSYGWSDPAGWRNPAIPKDWVELCRGEMPPFDPAWTPTTEMGVIPETFRGQPGVLRSDHPVVSFAAWGKQAAWITEGHTMDFPQGEGSPLARVYDLEGWVLLLGVGHRSNTSLHLAEYRARCGQAVRESRSPVLRDGACTWIRYRDIDYRDDDFRQIGEAFERQTNHVKKGRVCYAPALLVPQRPLVDFAVPWMELHRS